MPTKSVEFLFRAYRPRLLGYFISRRFSQDRAEDFVQDVFLRYNRAGYELDEEQARSAIFKIAENVFFDHLRHLKVQRQAGVSSEQLLEISEEIVLVDRAPGPDRAFQDKQELDEILARIQSLPPKCRDVFIDFRFRNLSQKQISAKRGISVSMVEKHVALALRKLKSDKG